MDGQRAVRGITRVYSPRQVVEQKGTRAADYTVARDAAEQFYARLRELFARGQVDHHASGRTRPARWSR